MGRTHKPNTLYQANHSINNSQHIHEFHMVLSFSKNNVDVNNMLP